MLSAGLGLESIGEFLNNSYLDFAHAVHVKDSGLFSERVHLLPTDYRRISDRQKFYEEEYWKRINLISEYEKPLVVKAFVSARHYDFNPHLLEDTMQRFYPLVLVRKDGFRSLLSQHICYMINTWHVSEVSETLAEQLSKSFEMPEDLFMYSLSLQNRLVDLYNAAPRWNRILYEEFADNPVEKLTRRFNLKYQIKKLDIIKFIGSHETMISNAADLKKLYDEHAHVIQ